MAAEAMTARLYPLRDWLRIFHPVYRPYLAGMLGIGIVGGILTYLNLELLQGLVQTFSAVGDLDRMSCEEAGRVFLLTGLLVCNGVSPGWVVAIIVLITYVSLELLQAALGIGRLLVQSHLEIRSRNDIEREILLNLMRKDDQFFQRQSATQIANRLDEDTQRMFERREDIAGLWSVSIQALGAVAFLWLQHWSYAAAVLVFSLIGVYAIHRMLGAMRALDGAQLQSDDNVKAAFEDYLYAVPEAQMGNLSQKIARQLGRIQEDRRKAFMGLIWLNGKLTATYSVTQLIAFGAIMCAIAYVVVAHGFRLEDGLIAAVVRAVPQLYGNISEVAKLFTKFQLADVSARRLLEYQTEFDKEQEPIPLVGAPSSAIVLDGVRYSFTPGGPQQGGPEGITLSVAPRSLNVVVGPSGSGKSMLSQLIMGRLRPLTGKIHYGDWEISELSQANRAQIFSHMPQTLAMISGSIRDNLNFGLQEDLTIPDGAVSDDIRAWIDRTGVGFFAREKALDLQPDQSAEAAIGDGLADLRRTLRARMLAELRVELKPFTSRALVPHFSILEHVAHAAAAPDKAARLAFSRSGFKFLDRLSRMPPADAIVGFGQHVVERTRHILSRCQSYDAYIELAPFHIRPEVWDLRSDVAGRPEIDTRDPQTRSDLLLIGLTATPQEADDAYAKSFVASLKGESPAAFVDACATHFGPALEALEETKLNLSLNWRDNLLFGAPDAVNTPTARAMDQLLIEAVAETRLDRELLRSGLEYPVGRQGKRLSGGQRQLICLCRALIRDTPALMLDEPTAALDPRRRQSINSLLREIASERTIIAITHDADLARMADQVVMMRSGQLWVSGSFSTLSEENADFRRLVRLDEALV